MERNLPTRRRRANKGKRVALSMPVYAAIDKIRAGRSFDSYFRHMLGLPDRRGYTLPLVEGMLETISGTFILKLEDTTWNEIEETAFKLADSISVKKKVKFEKPIKMRELR